ncbi:MAG: four helix bundle protein [Desulfobacterales bacterium]|nr:four helix bundle protein [Desulfobacterales bacterium]
MENRDFAQQLDKRTREFAIAISNLSSRLPKTPEGQVIRNQITTAGTSDGANYREAKSARSKADFRNKIKICESESSETHYWFGADKRFELGTEKRKRTRFQWVQRIACAVYFDWKE